MSILYVLSAAMKNTLDYFLEEYFFKPSAIVSYSPGFFGGINAAQQLRLVFAELGAPSIPSSFAISRVNEVFDDNGKLTYERYDKTVVRFLDEFKWYIETNEKMERPIKQPTLSETHKVKIDIRDQFI
ncbi:MAG: NAD(P)H-dependent oxidoreductase [Candidatus Nitrosopolaris sp.]